MATLEEIVNHMVVKLFSGKMPEAKNNPDAHLRFLNSMNVQAWDGTLQVLIHPLMFPNEKINNLCTLFWKLVEQRITPVACAVGLPLAGLHVLIAQEKSSEIWKASIYMPKEWYKMVQKDPLFQAGAVVYTASKCVDFWHKKIGKEEDHEALEQRARAWESEYLLTVKKINPEFKPNEYQNHILANFSGIENLDPKYKYEMKEWPG